MKMLMNWLKPAIHKRMDKLPIEKNEAVKLANTRFYELYAELGTILGEEHSDIHNELESCVNWLRAIEGEVTFEYGILDGMALGSEMQGFFQNPVWNLYTDETELKENLRRVQDIAKNASTVGAAEDRYESALMRIEAMLPDQKDLLTSLHDAVHSMREACVEVSYRTGLSDNPSLGRRVV